MGRKRSLDEQTVIKKKPHAERQVLVTRAEWGAREPTEALPPVPVPVHDIVVTWTDTPICEFPSACKRTVKEIQDHHMDTLGLPDIRYNFLVGTDKQMYEGRGWDMAGPTYPETIKGATELNGKTIEIALIDKYMEEPSVCLAETLLKFLAKELDVNIAKPIEFKGIKNNKLIRFSHLFKGEIIDDWMYDEDEKAAAKERELLSERLLQERLSMQGQRQETLGAQVEALLAEQRATIRTKTPEQLKAEYGFTEDVDATKVNYETCPDAHKLTDADFTKP